MRFSATLKIDNYMINMEKRRSDKVGPETHSKVGKMVDSSGDLEAKEEALNFMSSSMIHLICLKGKIARNVQIFVLKHISTHFFFYI